MIKRPLHTHFFVTSTDIHKPVHPETVRRWAVNTLKAAGVVATPHSIHSAHASMASSHNERIDSIIEEDIHFLQTLLEACGN